MIDDRVARGARRIGWKVGLTSEAMQLQLGVDQPDFGPLLDDMRVPCGGEVKTASLIAPRIEGEIAFTLRCGISGPDVTVEQVADAVALVVPALEIIDSRIADWRIALGDTIADHASCAMFITANHGRPLDAVELLSLRIALLVDGEEVEHGSASAVLGNPLRAVAWLANTLKRYDQHLAAGDTILAGALHASIPIQAGMHVEARLSDPELATVSVFFA